MGAQKKKKKKKNKKKSDQWTVLIREMMVRKG
jgi:hypothetical protein